MNRGLLLVAAAALLASLPAVAADSDGDGVDDALDNCVYVANNQYDADLDGYGNMCDCDVNNDGDCEYYDDISIGWCSLYQVFPACELADANGDGVVDAEDGNIFAPLDEPGPSGLSCAGGSDCAPVPPHATLPIVQVYDRSPYDGTLDQDDVDDALTICDDGCNLLFLADTYEDVQMLVDDLSAGFAMYGFGMGKTTLRAPIYENHPLGWGYLVRFGPDAPDGIHVEDMTLDGRSQEQLPRADGTAPVYEVMTLGGGILTSPPDPTYRDRADGVIRNVEFLDFVSRAVQIWNAVGWTIEDNVVHRMGCHQVDVPCGDLLGLDPNPWDELDDPKPNVPGRKVPGFGIFVNYGSDLTIQGNVISRVTKIGIHTFLDGVEYIDIIDNEVSHSHSGFAAGGSSFISFIGNRAHDMVATGAESQSVGHGFTCIGDGEGLVWSGNEAWDNQGAGFALGCEYPGIVFEDNVSYGNCTTATAAFADIGLKGWRHADGNWVSGLTITNPFSDSPDCAHGLRIQRHADVTVSGGSVTGGTSRGIWIRAAHNVEIEDIDVISSDPAGPDSGVFFDFSEPDLNVGVEPLSEVYVQPTTNVTGFDTTAGFTSGYGLDDEDDVAFCALESPGKRPPGCDNYP